MDVELIITTPHDLDKSNLLHVGKIVNKVFGKSVIGGKGKKICDVARDGDGTHYVFEFDCDNSEDTCDVLASELYTNLEFDFEVQIECEIDEDYLEPCDDDKGVMLIDDSDSQEHAQWVSECINEGWKFGMDYDKNRKTSPFLKPYHTLSEKQKEVMIKSKTKHGKPCVDEDIMAECFNGVK